MTRRGQFLDFTGKSGGCMLYAGLDGISINRVQCGHKKTHVVKWAPDGIFGRLRHFVCAGHAAKIVTAQALIGAVCKSYPIRKACR